MSPAAPRDGVPGLRNYLRPCLLLLLSEGPTYGYDLLERVRELGLRAAVPGGIYRCLRAMEQQRLLRSHWEPSAAGPARRTYQLTGKGRAWLHAEAGELREAHEALHAYLERYQRLTDGLGEPEGAAAGTTQRSDARR